VLLAVQIGFVLAFAPYEARADSAVPAAPAGEAITATDAATELPPSEEPAATAGAGDNPGTGPAPGAVTGGPPAPDTGTSEEPDTGARPEPSKSDGSAPARSDEPAPARSDEPAPAPNPAERPCAAPPPAGGGAAPPAGGGTPAAAEQPCPAPTPDAHASEQPAAEQPGAEPPDGHAGESLSTPGATPDAPPEPRAHRPVAAPSDAAPLPYIAGRAPDRTSRPPRARRGGHAGPSPSAVDRPTLRALATPAGSAWLTSVAPAPPDRVIVSLGRRSRAGVGEGDGRHAGAERPPRLDPQPRRHSPTAPPLERTAVAASAAGSSGGAQEALSCVMFLLLAVSAAHELRRFRFRMLVPVAPGAPSLRDRPG
jgi:hypothetical protein